MGGNALKGFVERKNKEDHQRIVSKVLLFLSKFTKAEEVKYLNDKESFGDADIVVQYRNDKKFDKARVHLKNCGKPSDDYDRFLINEAKFSATYFKQFLD